MASEFQTKNGPELVRFHSAALIQCYGRLRDPIVTKTVLSNRSFCYLLFASVYCIFRTLFLILTLSTAFTKKKDKIVSEVEQSENDSKDANLTDLSNCYFKDLDTLNSKIEELIKQFSVTPGGKLARQIKRGSRMIKEEQNIQIYKLPVRMIDEVIPPAQFSFDIIFLI